MAKKYKLTQDGPEVQALLNKIDELKANIAPVSGETPTALESLSLEGVLYSVLTKAVNDLLNYYTKDDTYTKDEVATAIANADKVFVATYGTTTCAEIEAAIEAGKMPICIASSFLYVYGGPDTTHHWFNCVYGSIQYKAVRISKSNDGWSVVTAGLQGVGSRVNTIVGNESETTKYPSVKAVADAISNLAQSLTDSAKKIWAGTAAEYALLTPSDDTVYFIKP